MKIAPLRLGLLFGLCLALFHATWAATVALGWAQPLLDFIFWAHFITPPYRIETFDLLRPLILIALTFASGLGIGLIGGWLWNRVVSQ
jgi:hypothetical protein